MPFCGTEFLWSISLKHVWLLAAQHDPPYNRTIILSVPLYNFATPHFMNLCKKVKNSYAKFTLAIVILLVLPAELVQKSSAPYTNHLSLKLRLYYSLIKLHRPLKSSLSCSQALRSIWGHTPAHPNIICISPRLVSPLHFFNMTLSLSYLFILSQTFLIPSISAILKG